MTNSIAKKWHDFWKRQSSPMYARGEDFPARYAEELRLILREAGRFQSVLELGCGSGELFALLGFDDCDYTGVDFSAAMLGAFAAEHPATRLVEANAAEYFDQRTYDLIFSSGLVQYFDLAAFEKHLANCRRMMSRDSVILHTGLPWSRHRWLFHSGWGPGRPPARKNSLRRSLRPWYSLARSRIGRWYSPQSVVTVAADQGLRCQFFGSLYFIYRFHVLLRRDD